MRDSVGIKPLYYFLDEHLIAYSSEVRSFKKILKNLDFNDDWKVYLLLFGYKLNINWGAQSYRAREVMVPWQNGKTLPNWEPRISIEKGLSKLSNS